MKELFASTNEVLAEVEDEMDGAPEDDAEMDGDGPAIPKQATSRSPKRARSPAVPPSPDRLPFLYPSVIHQSDAHRAAEETLAAASTLRS
mmetsp:Transcript_36372/g.42197  ORF Transcript_36372/g.42197 Transcript_36372/m.42197 type:complete len:90 (-) Transcript_36372:18-287(-)